MLPHIPTTFHWADFNREAQGRDRLLWKMTFTSEKGRPSHVVAQKHPLRFVPLTWEHGGTPHWKQDPEDTRLWLQMSNDVTSRLRGCNSPLGTSNLAERLRTKALFPPFLFFLFLFVLSYL